jgi:hypothetical protein
VPAVFIGGEIKIRQNFVNERIQGPPATIASRFILIDIAMPGLSLDEVSAVRRFDGQRDRLRSSSIRDHGDGQRTVETTENLVEKPVVGARAAGPSARHDCSVRECSRRAMLDSGSIRRRRRLILTAWGE